MADIFDQLSGQPQRDIFDELSGATQPVESQPQPSSTFRRVIADPVLGLVRGAAKLPNVVAGLADIPTGGRVGKFIEDTTGYDFNAADKFYNPMLSPETQEAQRKVSEAQGFFPTVKAAIQNPSAVVQTVAESIPSMFAGGAMGRGLTIAAKAPQLAYLGGAAGEGLVSAGQMAEDIRTQNPDRLLTPKQSAMSAVGGLGTAAFGALGGKVANSKFGQKLGLADFETDMAAGAFANRTPANIAKRALGGAVTEGAIEEMPQSAWEQAAQNIATDKPVMEGVGDAAALGLISGGLMGSGYNAAFGHNNETEQPPTPLGNPVATSPVLGQPVIAPQEAAPVSPDTTFQSNVPHAQSSTATTQTAGMPASSTSPVYKAAVIDSLPNTGAIATALKVDPQAAATIPAMPEKDDGNHPVFDQVKKELADSNAMVSPETRAILDEVSKNGTPKQQITATKLQSDIPKNDTDMKSVSDSDTINAIKEQKIDLDNTQKAQESANKISTMESEVKELKDSRTGTRQDPVASDEKAKIDTTIAAKKKAIETEKAKAALDQQAHEISKAQTVIAQKKDAASTAAITPVDNSSTLSSEQSTQPQATTESEVMSNVPKQTEEEGRRQEVLNPDGATENVAPVATSPQNAIPDTNNEAKPIQTPAPAETNASQGKSGSLNNEQNIKSKDSIALKMANHRAFQSGMTEGAMAYGLKDNTPPFQYGIKSGLKGNDLKAFEAGFNLAKNEFYFGKYKDNKNLLAHAIAQKDVMEKDFSYVQGDDGRFHAEPPTIKPGLQDKQGTDASTINEAYQRIKLKHGEKHARKYFEQVDRLINPNQNTVVDYRDAGVVVKKGDKYEFHPIMGTDYKSWWLSKPQDITEQMIANNGQEAKTPAPMQTQEPTIVKTVNGNGKVKPTGNAAKDTMLQYIASMGGINKAKAMSAWGEGVVPVNSLQNGRGHVFSKEGQDIDQVAQRLADAGYVDKDVHGKADIIDLENKLRNSFSGNPHYSNQSDTRESKLDAEFKAEQERIGEQYRAESIDDSAWKQEVAIEGDKKQVKFGDKKVDGSVGLSEFMDGFTPDPQQDLFGKAKPALSDADTFNEAEHRDKPANPASENFDDLDIPFSRTTAPVENARESKESLASEFQKVVNWKALEKTGSFHIVQTAQELPEGSKKSNVKGVVTKEGQVYFVSDQIAKGTETGILLHEIGNHYGLENMLGAELHAAVMKQMENLKATNKSVQEAFKLVPKDTKAGLVNEEALGYLAEINPKHGIIRRVLAAIKAFLYRNRILVKAEQLNGNDMIALLKASLNKVSRDATSKEGQNGTKRDLHKSTNGKEVRQDNNTQVGKVDERNRYSFAGTKAANADLKALSRAEEMIKGLERGTPEFDAADRKAWKETGWTHAFPDGKPRFEISDDGMAFLPQYADAPMSGIRDLENTPWRTDAVKQKELFNHPELEKNYPQSLETKLQTRDADQFGKASFNPTSNTIEMEYAYKSPGGEIADGTKSTLLHENTHAIQEGEGFAKGGTVAAMETEYNNARARLNFLEKEPDYLQGRAKIDKLWNDVFSDKTSEEEAIQIEQQILKEHPSYAETRKVLKDLNTISGSSFSGGNNWQQPNTSEIGMSAYKRLAGESEARLTQKRMALTPEQRREQYPIDQFDVNPKDQIVRMFSDKDGNRMSLEEAQYEKEYKNNFIKTIDGNINFGNITLDMGKQMRREAAPLRLRLGNKDEGLTHIEMRHGQDIIALGYNNAVEFIHDITSNFNAIYPAQHGALDLVVTNGKLKFARVKLELSEDGSYYDIKTATPGRNNQYSNKEPLWENAGPSVSSDVNQTTLIPGDKTALDTVNSTPSDNNVKQENDIRYSVASNAVNNARDILQAQADHAKGVMGRINNWLQQPGGLGALPDANRYLGKRYLVLGKLSNIQQETHSIFNIFKSANGATSKAIYDYLTTKDADINSVPQEFRTETEKAKQTVISIGEKLVALGMLKEATFEENRGEYLPRVYLKYLIGEEASGMLGNGKKLDLSYLKQRKDIPEDVRRLILGEIKDPGYLLAKAVSTPMRDMALVDWLSDIATNDKWVLPKSLIEWQATADSEPKKVTPFYLKAEADRLEMQIDVMPEADRAEATDLVKKMRVTANQALENLPINPEDVPKDYRMIPKSARYGKLRGMIVRKEIHNDIVGNANFSMGDNSLAEKILGTGGTVSKLTGWWKWSKVAANPPAQVRNFVSNMILLHLSGVSLHKVPQRMYQAAMEMKNNGEKWKIAVKHGVTESSFANTEMMRIRDEFVYMMAKNQEGATGWQAVKNFASKYGTMAVNKSGDLYQLMEGLGKTAKIIDMMEKGATAEEAALEAHKALFDYSLVNENVRYLRNAPIGVPFITFATKIAPRLLDTAIHHPARFAPYVAMAYGMQYLVAAMTGIDDDDLDKIKKSLPEWIQNKQHTYLLPWKDDKGRWQVVDLGYFFPWTQWTEMADNAVHGKVKEAFQSTGILGGPLPDLIAAVKTNTDPFTKRPIMDKYSSPSEQAGQIFGYLYQMAMPPWLTQRGVAGKVKSALSAEVDKYGLPKSTGTQAGLSAVGLNMYGYDAALTRGQNIKRMMNEIEGVKTQMTSEMKDRNLTPEKRIAIRKEYVERIQKMNKKRIEYARSSLPSNSRILGRQ